MIEMNLFTEKNRLAHIRNKFIVTKGEGGHNLKSLGLADANYLV